MRPSRNAFIGYTYQEQITFLFLVMMDVERKFNSLEIEADVENNFDDIKIQNGDDSMFFQIKDYDEITLEDLQFNANEVSIKGKKHLLANDRTNVLVFKNIGRCFLFELKPTLNILNYLKVKDYRRFLEF